MILKMLMENTSGSCELKSEHGLSIYIEVKGRKILFDAGQTSAFAENAESMQVNLAEVDTAILSHGHYDHSGGLQRFLELNTKAKVLINEHAFHSFYSNPTKEIGIASFLQDHNQVVITSDYTKLGDGIELFTCNAMERQYETDSNNLFVECGESLTVDPFLHEQYLLITEGEKRVLISGCSHKGILNIVKWFEPEVLIGGFHFKGIEMNEKGKRKLDSYAEKLKEYNTKYYTCHCTGIEQYEYLRSEMHTQVEYLASGDIIEV